MTDDRFEADLRAWLRGEAARSGPPVGLHERVSAVPVTAAADRGFHVVPVSLDPSRSRRFVWVAERIQNRNGFATMVMAIALVLVAVVGIDLLPAGTGSLGTGPTPRASLQSPSPSPSPSSSPPASPQSLASPPLPSPCATTGSNIDNEANARACGGAYPTVTDAIGKQSVTADGVAFSFKVPAAGWERWGDFSLQNGARYRGQAAEAIIYWTAFPGGAIAEPCSLVLSSSIGPSVADAAYAVAAAPGIEVVTGPLDITVGGRDAKYVEMTLREALGCNQGYFHTWPFAEVAALWRDPPLGGTIKAWIVDVDGTRLFIAGETRVTFPSEYRLEIQQIVDSIQFD